MKKFTYAAYDWNGRLVELSVIAENKAEAGTMARSILENARDCINVDEGIFLMTRRISDEKPLQRKI